MPLAQEPLVCAIMLTRDRPEMAARAVRCFREQTYPRKRLLIANSGPTPLVEETEDIREPCFVGLDALSIGEIRNTANRYAAHHYVGTSDQPAIFIHWDDDDWSHPNRIAEQVALLQASGKECVGYKDLLFWNTQFPKKCPQCKFGEILRLADGSWTCRTGGCEFSGTPGEAWLWKHPLRGLPGTSLCYWRKTWEQRPFPDLPKNNASEGEDIAWLRGVDSLGISSMGGPPAHSPLSDDRVKDRWLGPNMGYGIGPRMIASIHGSNTMAYTDALLSDSTSWVRVPQFDQLCRERMAL